MQKSGTNSPLTETAFGELSVAQIEPAVVAHFPYNLNSDIVSTVTTGSGSVTHSGQFAVASSGAATSSSGQLLSKRVLEYHPGIGALCRFTCIYDTGTVGNEQVAGIGNDTDGLFFGYNGTSFGILHKRSSSNTWIPQTSWSIDAMDGTGHSGMTLDTSKGNVFQIRYQWLGFGALSFYIENENTGQFQLVHRIDYANSNTLTSMDNPSLPFCFMSINTTNNTNVEMKVASFGLFLEGKVRHLSHTRNAIDNEKTISASTETNILTIRNKTTYQSVQNLVQIQPDFFSAATDGTKTVDLHIYKNATLGGTPSYSDISTNTSVVEYDTAGTTISGGTLIASISIQKVGNQMLQVGGWELILSPGETLTISALSSGGSDVFG